jgi:hypothetical protein
LKPAPPALPRRDARAQPELEVRGRFYPFEAAQDSTERIIRAQNLAARAARRGVRACRVARAAGRVFKLRPVRLAI